MSLRNKPENVLTLNEILVPARKFGYAVGSFSPRYTPIIRPVLRAGKKTDSPLIVQISQKELLKYGITPMEFADEFYTAIKEEEITVPVVLHLDHTKEIKIIKDAIETGFTSVMIDASELSLEDNIAKTKEVVEYAHARGVSVEAELGKIGTTDFVETDKDEELYTDPKEAELFVRETKVDALAVSVGTAHGVYLVRQPKIDYDRLKRIGALTQAHLVLHGGSGIPSEMMLKAIKLDEGSVSKVNIATDIEIAFLGALNKEKSISNEECKALEPEYFMSGADAAEKTVIDKIKNFLACKGFAVQK